MSSNVWQILILLFVLILINAFFAAAEMAIVSSNKNKIELLYKEGNKKAKKLLKLIDEPTKFLSTIQVGITFAGFFSSASAATGLSDDLGKVFADMNIPYGNQIALILVTLILSYFTLVLGELLPKRIALKKPEGIALFAIGPISFLMKIFTPFIALLSFSVNLFLKILRINVDKNDDKVSRDEIKTLIRTGSKEGTLNNLEEEILDSVFDFSKTLACEVMTSRKNVFMIDIKDDRRENINKIISENYSRIPVYEDEVDHIIGVLYLKDLVKELAMKMPSEIDLRQILREPFFITEIMEIQNLFKEMKKTQNHLAILIDEYGGFSGIVTNEDLIEEIMGEIYDEYDMKEEDEIVEISDHNYLVTGNVSMSKVINKLDLLIKNNKKMETLSSFLINKLGYIPIDSKEISLKVENVTFIIKETTDKQIKKVEILIDEVIDEE